MNRFRFLLIIALLAAFIPAGADAAAQTQGRKNPFAKSAPLTPGQQKIRNDIAAAQASLPVKISDEMSFTAMEFDQKTPAVVMVYDITSRLIDYDTMKKNLSDPDTRQDVLNSLMMNPMVAAMIETMAQENLGLSLRYSFPPGGKTLSIAFTGAELRSATANRSSLDPKDVALKAVNREIAGTKVPMELGSGLVMEKIGITDGNVVYLFRCDENGYTIDDIGPFAEMNKDANWDNLMKNPLSAQFLRNIHAAGFGLIYEYSGTRTGKTYQVVYSNMYMDSRLNGR